MRKRTQCEQDALVDSAAARILVVDDEPSVRKMLTTLLSQAGVPCSAAANVGEALIMLEKTVFQAVISDLRMGATSGLELLRKLAIPDSILLKPGALSEQERQIMERHVEFGYDLVKGIPFLADAAGIILAHHEHHNGSGYPRGLRGKDIPMFARIFAVVDSFDAITSDRPYRSALPVHTARSVVDAGRGELFDPEIVDAFFAVGEDAWKRISADSQTTSTHKIICRNGLTVTSAPALTPQVPHLEKVAN